MAKYCAVCEEKIGFGDSVKIEDGYIDLKCAKKVVDKPTSFTGQDITPILTTKKIKEMIDTGSQISVHDYKNKKKQEKEAEKEEAKALKEEFKKNADVDCFGNLYIDREKHQMLIPRKIGQQHHVYNFSELESSTRTDRMKTNTTTKKKGGITRSLVGSALTGGAGAIVGAATAKSHGTSNELLEKAIFVLTFSDGRVYQFEVMAGLLGGDKLINVIESNLNMIVSNNKKQEVEEKKSIKINLSYIDELKQLKELMDSGIISEEEFDKKKTEILEQK